ncbi:hypothetical protein R9X47_22725 [Wukongibacter baidiensis]|uniref:hypothetical protein n=1 Tax=Wukongibacter baidiensis TaxID=1723361 RepID=UPI003D7F7E32
MKKNEFKFTFEELLIFFFNKKKCPHCGNQNLSRYTHKYYKGTKRSTEKKMNLMLEEIYENTLIYECKICKRKYTLKGLKKNTELNEDYIELETNSADYITLEKVKMSNQKAKLRVRKFFNALILVFMLILVSIAIGDQNYIVVLIFAPLIVFVFFLLRYFTR